MKKLIFQNYRNLQSDEDKKINIFGIEFDDVYSKQDNQRRKIYNDLVQETHRNIIRASVSQEKLYKDYSIHLLINRTTNPLITSDNPIIKQGDVKFKDIIIPSRIFLPISPYHCILLAHTKEKRKPSEILLKDENVNIMNYWQYNNSNKYIISNRQNIKKILAKIENIKKKYPEIPLCAFIFRSNTSNKEYKFLI